MKAFLKARLVDPIARQLTQGVTPAALALALALGLTVGTLPVLGLTTLACALAAAALRLNQPAIQVANYAAYPLQLLLYIPFFQAGAWLFGAPPLGLTVEGIKAELTADLWGTMGKYAWANVRAVGAWATVAVPATLLLFAVLRALLERLPAVPRTREP
ncbi:MAG: DUF2062 domain-containing protein [Anaeromyxobacteraceae bacterium]